MFQSLIVHSSASLHLESKDTQHVLGVKWNYVDDELQIHINARSKLFTRRGILSVVSSVFDPLGMLAPVLLVTKIIRQDLFRTGIGWGDEVDKQTSHRWKDWLAGLPRLSHVAIKRCFFSVPVDLSSCVTMELHHFAEPLPKGMERFHIYVQSMKGAKYIAVFFMPRPG